MKETEVEIALFPIPGSVSLPKTVVPLHVFEPRYRKLIHNSIRDHRRIAVAHAKKQTSASKIPTNATEEDFLKHNLETYEPYPIFSAGFARITETLADGRILVEIEMDDRYVIIEEIQDLPYKIARCKRYQDELGGESIAEAHEIRLKLDALLKDLDVPNTAKLNEFLSRPEWLSQNIDEYSFKIFTVIRFEPEILQNVLELRSAEERISFLYDALKKTPYQN